MRHHSLPLLVLPLLFATACADPVDEGGSQEDDVNSARTQYVDIFRFLQDDDYERWFTARRTLVQQFDQICGDTFCGGEWTNLYSLGFDCSVSSKIGKVRECLWTFAGSNEAVSAATGAIDSSVSFFECRIKPGGNAVQLVDALAADPLYAHVEGLGGSIYDQLGDCFENPVSVPALPEPTEGDYVESADVIEGADVDAYYTVTRALREEFDQVCGDSYCEGELTNLEPLRFRCSQTASDGRLGECLWVFAGSDTSIDSKGFHRLNGKSFACKLPVAGSLQELLTTFDPANTDTPLFDRALPGGSETLGDALNRCL